MGRLTHRLRSQNISSMAHKGTMPAPLTLFCTLAHVYARKWYKQIVVIDEVQVEIPRWIYFGTSEYFIISKSFKDI